MSIQGYQYERLGNASQQIRLVSILPVQGRKRLHLNLETTSIDQVEGQYEAVSYMWGPPSPLRHIIINGKTLRLRKNIWRCLRHLRDQNLTESRLWIDTICVDQSNDHEKSQQVSLMARIFKSASKVLIWLGSTSLQTHLLPHGSVSLHHSIEALPPKDWDCWIDVLGYTDSRRRSLENQIMSIVYNSYWYRLWIIQEVSLAQNACIVFGKAMLGVDCIPPLHAAARENSKPGYRAWIARQQDPEIETLSTALLDFHPMLRVCGVNRTIKESLSDLVRTYHWRRCTDPRDYIFALLGLLENHHQIQIDYTLTHEEIAVRVLQHFEAVASEDDHSLGLDITAAAALLKALTVTSSSFLRAQSMWPIEKAEALLGIKVHVQLRPMAVLIPDYQTRDPDALAYEQATELNVSGSLTKTIYLMKKNEPIAIKLRNGQLKYFDSVGISTTNRDPSESNQPGSDTDVLLWCSLYYMPCVILRRYSVDMNPVRIKHFIWPDMTRSFQALPLSLEMKLPKNVKDALAREINACGNMADLVSGDLRCLSLQLSILEIISLCELIVPEDPDIDEFWKNT